MKKQKKLRFNPCGHYIIVKPEVIKKGRFILNDDTINREQTAKVRGEIVAIGDSAWDAFGGDKWAKVGDKVIFKRHVSDKIEDENDSDEDGKPAIYFLLTDENILAVIED